MEITADTLIQNGYKKWKNVWNGEYCPWLYQKCVYDEDGSKKYFINVKEWDFSMYERDPNMKKPSYETEVQLTKKDNNNAINLLLLSGWSLEDMEKFIEDMWQLGWFKLYEKRFEGDD